MDTFWRVVMLDRSGRSVSHPAFASCVAIRVVYADRPPRIIGRIPIPVGASVADARAAVLMLIEICGAHNRP